MGKIDLLNPYPVVILGNGKFPTHPTPLKRLRTAKTLICINGGADRALEQGLSPSLLIGDMDSLTTDPSRLSCDSILQTEQENTDLEKALDWCVENKITETTLLGITGHREDFTLTNFLAMKEYSVNIFLTTVTDFFTIYYVEGRKEFSTRPGQTVSFLSLGKPPKITTTGLKFALKCEFLITSGHGISNEAIGEQFTVTVDKEGLFVFIAHPS